MRFINKTVNEKSETKSPGDAIISQDHRIINIKNNIPCYVRPTKKINIFILADMLLNDLEAEDGMCETIDEYISFIGKTPGTVLIGTRF